jgi:hypothetical protein
MYEFAKIFLSITISSIICFVVTLIVYVTKHNKEQLNSALRIRDPDLVGEA